MAESLTVYVKYIPDFSAMVGGPGGNRTGPGGAVVNGGGSPVATAIGAGIGVSSLQGFTPQGFTPQGRSTGRWGTTINDAFRPAVEGGNGASTVLRISYIGSGLPSKMASIMSGMNARQAHLAFGTVEPSTDAISPVGKAATKATTQIEDMAKEMKGWNRIAARLPLGRTITGAGAAFGIGAGASLAAAGAIGGALLLTSMGSTSKREISSAAEGFSLAAVQNANMKNRLMASMYEGNGPAGVGRAAYNRTMSVFGLEDGIKGGLGNIWYGTAVGISWAAKQFGYDRPMPTKDEMREDARNQISIPLQKMRMMRDIEQGNGDIFGTMQMVESNPLETGSFVSQASTLSEMPIVLQKISDQMDKQYANDQASANAMSALLSEIRDKINRGQLQ